MKTNKVIIIVNWRSSIQLVYKIVHLVAAVNPFHPRIHCRERHLLACCSYGWSRFRRQKHKIRMTTQEHTCQIILERNPSKISLRIPIRSHAHPTYGPMTHHPCNMLLGLGNPRPSPEKWVGGHHKIAFAGCSRAHYRISFVGDFSQRAKSCTTTPDVMQ